MRRGLRMTAFALALALGAATLAPRPACAAYGDDEDGINKTLTIGLLVVVVGVLVYVGWKMDQADKELKTEDSRLLPLLAANDDSRIGLYFDNASADADALDLTAGLAYRTEF